MAKKLLLSAFFIVIVALIVLAAIIKKASSPPVPAEKSLPPLQVRLSNFDPNGLTVSWFTEEKTSGAVIFSDQRKRTENYPKSNQVAEDLRGPAAFSKVHFVTIKGLRPNQEYYLAIKSGPDYFFQKLDGSWDKNGFALEQKTPPLINFDPNQPVSPQNSPGSYSLEKEAWSPCYDSEQKKVVDLCFRPNFLQGKTIKPDGQPADQALVLVQIPGQSSLISALSDQEGNWSLNLASFFNQELTKYLAYNPQADLVRLTAQNDPGQFSSVYQEIPRVISSLCSGSSLPDCQKFPPEINQPISLILLPNLETIPSPTLSPTPLPNEPDKKISGFNNLKSFFMI